MPNTLKCHYVRNKFAVHIMSSVNGYESLKSNRLSLKSVVVSNVCCLFWSVLMISDEYKIHESLQCKL